MSSYPLVSSSLSLAHSFIASHALALSVYNQLEATSTKLLSAVVPHLPVDAVDGYAVKGLDYLEKRVPAVKTETGEGLVQRVRGPADEGVRVAREYAGGFTSVSWVFFARGGRGG